MKYVWSVVRLLLLFFVIFSYSSSSVLVYAQSTSINSDGSEVYGVDDNIDDVGATSDRISQSQVDLGNNANDGTIQDSVESGNNEDASEDNDAESGSDEASDNDDNADSSMDDAGDSGSDIVGGLDNSDNSAASPVDDNASGDTSQDEITSSTNESTNSPVDDSSSGAISQDEVTGSANESVGTDPVAEPDINVNPPALEPVCGNRVCEQNENADSCPTDCGKEQYIIVRSDDIGPWWSDEGAIAITELLREKGVPQVLSIIPTNEYGDKVSDDPAIANYLESIKNDSTIEFALHGYDHRQDEFKSITYADAVSGISAGNDIITSIVGIKPVSFVSPYNQYNADTLKALSEQKMSIISSGYDDVEKGLAFKESESILHIPQTTDLFNWEENRYYSTTENINSCENAMDVYGTCVLVLHHTLYANSDGSLDPAKVQTLTDIMDWAKEKENAGNTKIVTLKDLPSMSGQL